MHRGDQLSRQWRPLQLVDRPQGMTIDDAAREFDCAPRTVWRDLAALQQAGLPLYTKKASDGLRGLWRVTEDFKRALPLVSGWACHGSSPHRWPPQGACRPTDLITPASCIGVEIHTPQAGAQRQARPERVGIEGRRARLDS